MKENGESDTDFNPDVPESDYEPELSTRNLLGMSILSFLFYICLGSILVWFFHDGGAADLFMHGYSVPAQLAIGAAAGALSALIIMKISSRQPVAGVLNDFGIFKIIANARFSNFDRVQISLFAGIGEEFLFRGALQPLIGIWLTSVIFIAIHGYFKFTSAGHILFGLMMFGLSMLLGYLFIYAGLISAMVAHAIYDVVMLWWVKRYRKENPIEEYGG
jgi:uncharacterized protein